jgi:hypothetical protein
VDVFLPECRYLHTGPKLPARMTQWSQTLAIPAEARAVLLEILRLLGTLALIGVTAVIMLMAG